MSTAREDTVSLVQLLRKEHHALGDFLVALAAFDRARRWSELGYASLFDFLVRELGLPNGPAFYRLTAARLLQRFPELLEPVREGRLHLSSIASLAKVITPDNRAEVLPRFLGTSKREAMEVAAELAPMSAPPLRTVVTTVALPASPPSGSLADAAAPSLLPEEVAAPPPATLPAPPALARPAPTQVEPLTAELRRLHVTVSRRLLDKLAAARDALSHSHPDASEETILEVGLDLILDRYKKRRGIGAKPRKRSSSPASATTTGDATLAVTAGASPPPPPPGSQHVPAEVWREVWVRDGGRCAWRLENGEVCGSTYQLELDHIDGLALGGKTTAARTRLCCRPHNDEHARQLYGDRHMDRFTRRKGGRCSETVARYGRPAPRRGRAGDGEALAGSLGSGGWRPAGRYRAATAAK